MSDKAIFYSFQKYLRLNMPGNQIMIVLGKAI